MEIETDEILSNGISLIHMYIIDPDSDPDFQDLTNDGDIYVPLVGGSDE